MSVHAIARPRGITGALRRDVVVVGILFGVAVVAYLLLARLRVGPFIDNDEYLYGNAAQSIAAGDGNTWRGVAIGQHTLYPYVIAPAWVVADGATAYRLAQAIGVVLTCSIVWPVWLVARTVVRDRWALFAPVLVLLGVWMELSSKIMTEAVAFPAAVWALCLSVLALRRPEAMWLWGALAAISVAILTRTQLGVLLPILAVATTLEVVRRPRPTWSSVARERRRDLAVTWGLTITGLVMLVGPGRSALGDYSGVLDLRPQLTSALRWALDHATDVVLLVGVVPWVASTALLCSRRAWRSDDLGPFLCVLAPALAGFIALAGWFAAGEAPRIIERYVAYLGPLILIGLVPALRSASWRAAAGVTMVTALLVLDGHDPAHQGREATSLAATGKRLLGWDASVDRGSLWQLAALIALLGGGAAAALWLRGRRGRLRIGRWSLAWSAGAAIACVAVPAAWLVNTSDLQWSEANAISRSLRAPFGRTPDVVGRRLHGPTTLVAIDVPPSALLWLEFFNKKIDRAVVESVPPAQAGAGYGPACRFALSADGRFANDRSCINRHGSFLVVANPAVIPTLKNGGAAREVGVPDSYAVDGEPRFVAFRTPLCDLRSLTCGPAGVITFTTRPATLALRFDGGQTPHKLAVNGTVHDLPASTQTTIRVRIGVGQQPTSLQGDWQALSPDVPTLSGLTLQEQGRPRVSLN